MTTEKQVVANRENALKSTGPKTPAGKAVVRYNALKHGILSKEVLLPNERKRDFVRFSGGLRDALQPLGALEELLVERVITASWRLRRVLDVEQELFEQEKYDTYEDRIEYRTIGEAFVSDAANYNAVSKLTRYEAAIERGLYRALHEFQRLQAARAGGNVLLPLTADVQVIGTHD